MSSDNFERFAEQAQVTLLRDSGWLLDDISLKGLWDQEHERLALTSEYRFDPDRWDEDRLLLEDAVMDLYGYNPDWRDES